MDIPVFIQDGEKEPFPVEDQLWWEYISTPNRLQWGSLDIETKLVLEFNARELAKEHSTGLGEK